MRKVGEKLIAFPYLFPNTMFKINIVTIAMIFVAGLVALFFLRLATRKLDMRHPRGWQNIMEWGMEFTRTMVGDIVPSERFISWIMPLSFTVLVFLFVANWLGLIATVSIHLTQPIPWLGLTASALKTSGGEVALFDSPTANLSMTLGLAVIVWLISHYQGWHRPKAYFKAYLNPIHILEEITNPLTHGMRLYGNIFAGEVLIGAILTMPMLFHFIPTGLPLLVVWLLYSGFVATIQAYVFSVLLVLYIGMKSYHMGGGH